MTDYIVESNVIHVPDGVTDVLWDAFGIVKNPPRVYSWQIDSIEVHLPASVQRFMDWNLFSSSWRDFFNTEQYCAVHVHNPDMKIEAVAPEGKNIIYAAKGSFAEAFAQSHGMEFVVE